MLTPHEGGRTILVKYGGKTMFVFKTIIWGTIFCFITLIVGPWLALEFKASFPTIDWGWFHYVGTTLVIIGVYIAIYCTAVLFIPGKSRPAPYDAGGTFTIAGPYLYVRNPFMLGVVLALWGEAFFFTNAVIIAYALIFTWCIHFWVIFFEEPALQERFGKEYQDYKKAVPRWFPKFRKYIAK